MIRKYLAILLIITFSLFELPSIASAATLDTLNKQKAALAAQQEAAKKLAAQKAAEAAAFQNQIAAAQAQIDTTQNAVTKTQSQITDTEKTIADLVAQVTVQEENLASETKKMNDVVASWYMQGDNGGLLDTVLSSNSLSEVVDTNQYYDSIKQQILATKDRINTLKAQLNQQKDDQNKKKSDLEGLKSQQLSYQKSVENQKTRKNWLLSSTLAQRTDYLNQVKDLQGEIDSVSAEIYALRAKSKGNEVWIYGTTSYPYGNSNALDQWGFFQLQCTSYAAWYWNIKLGRDWYRGDGPTGTGDAANWPALASRNNVSVHSSPKTGAIISWQRSQMMPYGHVAIVENINADGTIDISEMNWVKYSYSYRKNVSPGYYGGYSYIY